MSGFCSANSKKLTGSVTPSVASSVSSELSVSSSSTLLSSGSASSTGAASGETFVSCPAGGGELPSGCGLLRLLAAIIAAIASAGFAIPVCSGAVTCVITSDIVYSFLLVNGLLCHFSQKFCLLNEANKISDPSNIKCVFNTFWISSAFL